MYNVGKVSALIRRIDLYITLKMSLILFTFRMIHLIRTKTRSG